MFGIEVAEIEEASGWSAYVWAVAIVNGLEVFAVILMVDRFIDVLVSEELEEKR